MFFPVTFGFVLKQTHALHQQLANLKMRFHKLFVYSSIVGVTFLIGQWDAKRPKTATHSSHKTVLPLGMGIV